MINTLQIIVLSALFQLEVPPNADSIMTMILRLVSLEVVQTEEYFSFFGFRETEPFKTKKDDEGEETSKYSDAGYESSNFFYLIGPILIMMVLFVFYSITKTILQKCFRHCANNCLGRRIMVKIEYMVVVSRFLIEGAIEIGLSAAITLLMMSEENFDTFWEAVSTSSAFAFMAVLLIAPFVLYKLMKKYL